MAAKKKNKKRNNPKMGKPPKLRVIPAPPTQRVNAPKWSRSEKEYFTELHKIVDEVFMEAADTYDWTWNKLALHAELSPQTVAKLGDRETKWPRFSTIYKLCKAVGIDLQLVKPKKRRKSPALKTAG